MGKKISWRLLMAKKVSAINWFKKSSDENRAKNVMLAIIHQMDKKRSTLSGG
jgi:hypothetical protein